MQGKQQNNDYTLGNLVDIAVPRDLFRWLVGPHKCLPCVSTQEHMLRKSNVWVMETDTPRDT